MTTSGPDQQAPAEPSSPSAESAASPMAAETAAESAAVDARWARVNRKRERIRAELERNRAGDHKVPTWVLAALLGLAVAGWILLLITA